MAFDREKLVTNWIWTPDWQIEDDHEARVVYFRKEIELTDTLLTSKKIRITCTLSDAGKEYGSSGSLKISRTYIGRDAF